MKNKTGLWIIIGIIILSIIAFTVSQFAINLSVPSGSFISFLTTPNYGYIDCEQSKQGIVTAPATGYLNFGSYSFNCNDFTGNTLIQSCTVNLKTPDKSEVTYANEVLFYKICNTPNCDNSQQNKIWLSQLGIKSSDGTFNQILNIPLQRGQYLVVNYQASNLLLGSTIIKNSAYAKMSFTPYMLYEYDSFLSSNGQAIPNTQDCQGGNYLSERNYLIESVSGNGKLSQILKNTPNGINGLRSPGAVVNFVSNYVEIPPQYALFNNNQNYCYNKNVYAVETITMSGGTYYVADTSTNKQLYSVDCCNTADAIATKGSTGYYCSNFKIVALTNSSNVQCSAMNPCPVVGYQPSGSKQVLSQTCDSGKCNNHYLNVQCSNVFDCPNGYCNIDAQNPQNNKCVYPTPQSHCGNGVCEASYGESASTCSADCITPPTADYTIFWIIGAFLVGVIAILIYAKYKK